MNKPQRGRPKRSELPDVNINTGVQSINTERASLMILMRRRRIMAAAFPGCQHQGILLIFSSFEITVPIFVKCYIGLVEVNSSDRPFPFSARWGVGREHVSSLGVGVGSVDKNQLTMQLFLIRKSSLPSTPLTSPIVSAFICVQCADPFRHERP